MKSLHQVNLPKSRICMTVSWAMPGNYWIRWERKKLKCSWNWIKLGLIMMSFWQGESLLPDQTCFLILFWSCFKSILQNFTEIIFWSLTNYLSRFNGKERALNEAEKRVLSIESQVNSLQARLADAASQRRQIEDDLNVSEIFIFFIFLGTVL